MTTTALSSILSPLLFNTTPRISLSYSSTFTTLITLKPPPTQSSSLHRPRHPRGRFSFKTHVLNISRSLFEDDDEEEEEDGEEEDDDDEESGPQSFFRDWGAEDENEIPCPPGLRQYKSLVVLRPNMTEDERLTLTQKYEELLVAGGGMYVEVFNRGVIPLCYYIEKKNKDGEKNRYSDGIYLLFTYFTKPESMAALEGTFLKDDDVIRFMNKKVRKRID